MSLAISRAGHANICVTTVARVKMPTNDALRRHCWDSRFWTECLLCPERRSCSSRRWQFETGECVLLRMDAQVRLPSYSHASWTICCGGLPNAHGHFLHGSPVPAGTRMHCYSIGAESCSPEVFSEMGGNPPLVRWFRERCRYALVIVHRVNSKFYVWHCW
jgi:hypothetical protein